ncbi:MAG: rhomboid family intramembrane serine protease [Planctomycetota bacterium]|nr:MAG: rhomboid family intramembrane serine protease [Planctomycetota bacterium]
MCVSSVMSLTAAASDRETKLRLVGRYRNEPAKQRVRCENSTMLQNRNAVAQMRSRPSACPYRLSAWAAPSEAGGRTHGKGSSLIPIGTDVRLRSRPIGNYCLIAANVLVMLIGTRMPPNVLDALLPPLHADVPMLHEYITYQFRHGDLWHLVGNMLFLWIFGNAVCDRMGSLNYVLFYLAGGVVAGVVFTQANNNPLVGASGAIAAVTTAFLVLFPRVHVTLLIWFFIITTIQLPAMILIVFKIILWDNVLAPSFERGMASNVAYSAHLGGYAFGLAVSLGMLLVRALPRNQFDLLALWSRWTRRTGMASEYSFRRPPVARPVRVEELESAPLESLPLSEAEQLREDILDRIAEHDLGEAAQLYERLRAIDPEAVLPRPQQLDLANHLAQHGDHARAAAAYESYLAAYPTAADTFQVRLLVGLIYRRYLHDDERAVEHLRAALSGVTVASQRELAQHELELAETHLSGPPEPSDAD